MGRVREDGGRPALLATSIGAPPTTDRENEDRAFASSTVGVVIDGAGLPKEFRRGCEHSVAWYADSLGRAFFHRVAGTEISLKDALADAIDEVRVSHGPACDLRQGSPSATVAAFRVTGHVVEHLVLCDATCLLLQNDGTVVHVTDRRLDDAVKRHAAQAPGQDPRSLRGRVSTLERHRDGGYWAAGADPGEAQHALVGRHRLADLAGVVLASDGATRAFERLGIHRVEEFTAQALDGDHLGVLDAVREAEVRQEAGLATRGEKIHDDFTVVSLRLPTDHHLHTALASDSCGPPSPSGL